MKVNAECIYEECYCKNPNSFTVKEKVIRIQTYTHFIPLDITVTIPYRSNTFYNLIFLSFPYSNFSLFISLFSFFIYFNFVFVRRTGFLTHNKNNIIIHLFCVSQSVTITNIILWMHIQYMYIMYKNGIIRTYFMCGYQHKINLCHTTHPPLTLLFPICAWLKKFEVVCKSTLQI